jgi:hypothetical protein
VPEFVVAVHGTSPRYDSPFFVIGTVFQLSLPKALYLISIAVTSSSLLHCTGMGRRVST